MFILPTVVDRSSVWSSPVYVGTPEERAREFATCGKRLAESEGRFYDSFPQCYGVTTLFSADLLGVMSGSSSTENLSCHMSLPQARGVASLLASRHPGEEFVILEAKDDGRIGAVRHWRDW